MFVTIPVPLIRLPSIVTIDIPPATCPKLLVIRETHTTYCIFIVDFITLDLDFGYPLSSARFVVIYFQFPIINPRT